MNDEESWDETDTDATKVHFRKLDAADETYDWVDDPAVDADAVGAKMASLEPTVVLTAERFDQLLASLDEPDSTQLRQILLRDPQLAEAIWHRLSDRVLLSREDLQESLGQMRRGEGREILTRVDDAIADPASWVVRRRPEEGDLSPGATISRGISNNPDEAERLRAARASARDGRRLRLSCAPDPDKIQALLSEAGDI